MDVRRSLKLVTLFSFIGVLIFGWQTRDFYVLDNLNVKAVKVMQEVKIKNGSIEQGILHFKAQGFKESYFSSNQAYISKFDLQWNLIGSYAPKINGMTEPHIGILSRSGDFIWGGVIDLKDYRARKSNTRIIKIDPKSLRILEVFEFSSISKYIDAFDVEGDEFWVGYKDFVKVYKLSDKQFHMVRSYRIHTGTPQGLRLSKDQMCIVGESVTMKTRGFQNGIYCYNRNELVEFQESVIENLKVFIDVVVSSLNYRLNLNFLNFHVSSQANVPQNFWSFGFPAGNVDNEGFSFLSERDGIIWISDVNGNVARKIILDDFGISINDGGKSN